MNEPGVVHYIGPLPPVAPGAIASSIKRATFEVLNAEPPSTSGAVVRLTHDRGAELAIAHRGKDGRWGVATWVGKSWDSDPVTWGAEIVVRW